jgi:uncharacterized protein with PIN domain
MFKRSRQEDLKRSQAVTTLIINGRSYERRRFYPEDIGEEDDEDESALCECEVRSGQLHLFGCELERCPRCGGQIISCSCEFEQRPGKPPLD